ncbi:hypothetical protein H0H93_003359, partial [Arthromyces matolae]
GLFDYCFPPNFRIVEQRKLTSFVQGNLTVREYASELKTLFMIVGHKTMRKKIRKLWDGLAPRLQGKLFENKFDPERSSFADIVENAEIYEIARTMGIDASDFNKKKS